MRALTHILDTGTRSKVPLMHANARKLGVDPHPQG